MYKFISSLWPFGSCQLSLSIVTRSQVYTCVNVHVALTRIVLVVIQQSKCTLEAIWARAPLTLGPHCYNNTWHRVLAASSVKTQTYYITVVVGSWTDNGWLECFHVLFQLLLLFETCPWDVHNAVAALFLCPAQPLFYPVLCELRDCAIVCVCVCVCVRESVCVHVYEWVSECDFMRDLCCVCVYMMLHCMLMCILYAVQWYVWNKKKIMFFNVCVKVSLRRSYRAHSCISRHPWAFLNVQFCSISGNSSCPVGSNSTPHSQHHVHGGWLGCSSSVVNNNQCTLNCSV